MLTAAGVEALLKVKEQKLANPDSLAMGTFLCGTVSCIAGQLILNQPEYKEMTWQQITSAVYDTSSFTVEAGKILGFDLEDVDLEDEDDKEGKYQQILASLFFTGCWPETLREKYRQLFTNLDDYSSGNVAQLVAERIDQFIEEHYQEENTNNVD